MYLTRNRQITAKEFALLRKQLTALSKVELAALFRVTRQTIDNWLKHGIPERNQVAIGNFVAISTYIANNGIQSFLYNQFQPTTFDIPLARQCTILYPEGGTIHRCTERMMDVRGMCAKHVGEVEIGLSFMTVRGNIICGGETGENALLPRRCSAVARAGMRCPTIIYDGSELCELHKGR